MAVRKALKNLRGFFLTELCPGCGTALSSGEEYMCHWCRARLYRNRTIHPSSAGNGIPVHSVFLHEGIPRELILRLKYGGERYLSDCITRLIMEYSPVLPGREDVVVPLPASSARTRERGFNQADLIGRHLAGLTDSRFEKLLKRKNRPPQVGLSEDQRRENVEGAFTAVRTIRTTGTIWLIDDVMTTGSTLDAASSALQSAGMEHISGITLTYRKDLSVCMI